MFRNNHEKKRKVRMKFNNMCLQPPGAGKPSFSKHFRFSRYWVFFRYFGFECTKIRSR